MNKVQKFGTAAATAGTSALLAVTAAGAQTTPVEDAETAILALLADLTPVVVGVSIAAAGVMLVPIVIRGGMKWLRRVF